MKVFVDTNVFVALRDENDSTHKKAIKILDKLHREKALLYTSSDIIAESLTVLSRKLGGDHAAEFLREIKKGIPKEIFIDINLHSEARNLFTKVKPKNISFIDCSSVVAMKTNKIETIFTFDKHFKSLGVELLK